MHMTGFIAVANNMLHIMVFILLPYVSLLYYMLIYVVNFDDYDFD